ncbi:MMPL family transporter [Streptomyces spectabilis]|uniref:MMPL family transporter n=1 Tax=Streptomyces spectabilis TaxID=68270 RepID=A0A5P2XG20_STRST|nr:MMPL family transporter [Streptomyces spectabilis]MBB5102047.1 RND superfamily putative drug exporter [Streptomyces spectabilis]MCI3907098.1 MMPL family transporter [Streptomyces spectabilis]QEV63863.1 MMPL family transporter [Streptomyces spectabilis]
MTPVTARPRLVLLLAALVAALCAVAGAGTHERLANGGYTAKDTEADRAAAVLARAGAAPPDLVLLARSSTGVDAAGARRTGLGLTRELAAADGVASTRSYWITSDTLLRSKDGRAALVTADLEGADRDATATARELVPELTGHRGPLDITATGASWVSVQAAEASARDLVTAELIAAPLTLLLLAVALRSLLAALVPVVIGALAVVGTTALLRALTYAMPVSVFAMNLTTALGFGLAVDYGLFLITRFREELGHSRAVPDAVARTVRTTGHTVVVSACTVALAMAALLVLPLPFLRSMACAGMAVALLAAAAALAVVPPLLLLLGERIGRTGRPDSPLWRRAAKVVTRRPALYGIGCAVALVLCAMPFGHVRFGLIDERTLLASTEAHATGEEIRGRFAAPAERTLTVVLPKAADAEAYRRRVAALDDVASVRPANVPGLGPVLTVVGTAEPQSAAAQRLVADLREASPEGARVAGRAAMLVDTKAAVAERLPLAGGVLAVTTWAMLFLLTRSVLLPFKALLVGALSLTASFGLVVHIFQDGHLRGVLGEFAVTGALDLTLPLLMAAVAFGLAIDYEIFLLSRVREQWLRGLDNRDAVVEGVARTGRLVTTAALAVALVTGVLATSGLTVLKLLGTGLAVAVLLDATVVRGILVPAFLTLAGRANWWAPAWLPQGDPTGAQGRGVRRSAPLADSVESHADGCRAMTRR